MQTTPLLNIYNDTWFTNNIQDLMTNRPLLLVLINELIKAVDINNNCFIGDYKSRECEQVLREDWWDVLNILASLNIPWFYHFTTLTNALSIKASAKGLLAKNVQQNPNYDYNDYFNQCAYVYLSLCVDHPLMYTRQKETGDWIHLIRVSSAVLAFQGSLLSDIAPVSPVFNPYEDHSSLQYLERTLENIYPNTQAARTSYFPDLNEYRKHQATILVPLQVHNSFLNPMPPALTPSITLL